MMQLTDKSGNNTKFLQVGPGDVVLIEDGVFHKVFHDETTTEPLYFVCVFDGKRNH